MSPRTIVLFASILLVSTLGAEGGVLFASLPKAIILTATINGQNVTEGSKVKVREDVINIKWRLNETFAGQDGNFKGLFFKLCFGPSSQIDRPWRKNNADLSQSKTCKYPIKSINYTSSGSLDYIPKDTVPGAYYFVRVFAVNVSGCIAPGECAVAFGQTSNSSRTSNLFHVTPYSGRHTSLIIVAIVISIVSYLSLASFFIVERMLKKQS
eukprot:jgi/Mesen1/5570/ME000280S04666